MKSPSPLIAAFRQQARTKPIRFWCAVCWMAMALAYAIRGEVTNMLLCMLMFQLLVDGLPDNPNEP